MVDAKISALPAVVTPTLADPFAVVNGGVTRRMTVQQALSLASPPAVAASSGPLTPEFGNEDTYEDFLTDPGWTWGNQGTSTENYGENGLLIVPEDVNELIAKWESPTIPASGDWAYVVELQVTELGGVNSQFGIVDLFAGSIGTPAGLLIYSFYNGASGPGVSVSLWTDYVTFSSNVGNPLVGSATSRYRRFYMVSGWDDSLSTRVFYFTMGGLVVQQSTVVAKPTDIGIGMSTANEGRSSAFYNMSKLVPVADVTVWPIPELYGAGY